MSSEVWRSRLEHRHKLDRVSRARFKAAIHVTPLILLSAVVVGGICARAQSPQQTKSAGDGEGNATRGKELFVKNACYQCHGYLGQGGSAGARIGPDPLPWQAMAAYIRKPAGAMPPFTSKLLPDKDVQDIYAYLKTVPGPTDIKNIPTFTK